MVAIPERWSAMLVSAVPVWIASAVMWMVLPHHKFDFMTVLPNRAPIMGKAMAAGGE